MHEINNSQHAFAFTHAYIVATGKARRPIDPAFGLFDPETCLSMTLASSSTDDGSPTMQPPQAGGVVGGAIEEGEGGIRKALAEGKGWGEADILAYAKTIGDNHPMFAESVEVRGRVGAWVLVQGLS